MILKDLIARLTDASLRRWRTFLLVALGLTVAGVWLASHLDVRTSFEELLPEHVPSVRYARELARRVGGDGNVMVVVEALDGEQGLKRVEAMTSTLAADFVALGPDVVRAVEADIWPVRRWYVDHWPMFLPLADLQRARDDLVKAIGTAKAKANPLLDLGEEDDAPATSDPVDLGGSKELADLLDPAKPTPRQQVEERFARYVDGFMVPEDHRSATIVIRPTGSSLGVTEAGAVLAKIRGAVEKHRAELDANRLRVGYAGSFVDAQAFYDSVIKGALVSFIIAMIILLASIALFYWEIRAVLVIGVLLTVGISVTFGLTWLVIGYLNTQTAFLGSIVAGNGLNYGVVYLARVGQLRRRGVALAEACREGAHVASRATLLAAIGTSVAFATLVVATNRGFRHFGFIGGVGMLLCWAATFALTPAILALFEKVRPFRGAPRERAHAVGMAFLERLLARPRAVVVGVSAVTIAAAAVFLAHLPDQLERNLQNLDNDPIASPQQRADGARAAGGYGQSTSGAIALLPTRAAAEAYCDVIRARLEARPEMKKIVQQCTTVSTVVPAHQEEKLALLAEIRGRLTDRILERLSPAQAARARDLRAELAAQTKLLDDQAPPSLLDVYRERDRTVGRIAFVRAQPYAYLEIAPNMRAYAAIIRNVPVTWTDPATGQARTEKFDAAGADLVLNDLLADIEEQGPKVTLLSFVCVCVLVVLFFRTWARSALLLGSLVAGVALMAGVATLAHIRINPFNFIVYPITFGIAVDYGANVLSRMGMRRTVIPAVAEVGPAVILCSWTTIVGYGSMIISVNRALRSFGWYAMLGEFTTLVTALVLLPAMAMLVPARAWMAAPGEVLPGEEAPSVEEAPSANEEFHGPRAAGDDRT
jgi:predicted RND superfamily exporter protein